MQNVLLDTTPINTVHDFIAIVAMRVHTNTETHKQTHLHTDLHIHIPKMTKVKQEKNLAVFVDFRKNAKIFPINLLSNGFLQPFQYR